jgi:predicted HD phosphohydrolase
MRTWDEQAKIPGLPTPGFDHYMAIVERNANRVD